MRDDPARQSLDRHATYIVATFVAGGRAGRGDTHRGEPHRSARARPSLRTTQ